MNEIEKIKKKFNSYYSYWGMWTNSNFCILTTEEKYFIEIQTVKSFIIEIDDIMYYNNLFILRQTALNLKKDNENFMRFFIERFKDFLVGLKQKFELYNPLWHEWKIIGRSKISEDNIKIIEDFAKNNFDAKLYDFTEMIKLLPLLQAAKFKLDLYYNDFQSWTINRFYTALLIRGINYNLDVFFNQDIDLLDISAGLKKNLKKFNVLSISCIVMLKENIFHNKSLFIIVTATLKMLLNDEIKLYKLNNGGGEETEAEIKSFNNIITNLN